MKGYRRNHAPYSTNQEIHFYGERFSGSFQTYDGRTVEMKLSSVPRPLALQIAAMFAPEAGAHFRKQQAERAARAAQRGAA
jgi:hypothetical protein